MEAKQSPIADMSRLRAYCTGHGDLGQAARWLNGLGEDRLAEVLSGAMYDFSPSELEGMTLILKQLAKSETWSSVFVVLVFLRGMNADRTCDRVELFDVLREAEKLHDFDLSVIESPEVLALADVPRRRAA